MAGPVGKLDHIGIAVRSVAEARKFFEGILGARFMYEAESERGGYRLAEFDLNGLTVELLEPLGANSFLHKFLEQRGEGMHHLTFKVPDMKGKVAELKAQGVRVVALVPRGIEDRTPDCRVHRAWDVWAVPDADDLVIDIEGQYPARRLVAVGVDRIDLEPDKVGPVALAVGQAPGDGAVAADDKPRPSRQGGAPRLVL